MQLEITRAQTLHSPISSQTSKLLRVPRAKPSDPLKEFPVRYLLGCLICLGVFAPPAQAGQLSSEKLAAFSPLFAAFSAGELCNSEIDIETTKRYLDGKLGPDVKYTNAEMAEATFMVIGQQAMQWSLGVMPTTKDQLSKYCASMMASFGPTGKQIPGILKLQ